MYYIYGKLNQG